MFKPTTLNEIVSAMQNGANVEINGIVGMVNSVEKEDGSGRCFNVGIIPNGKGNAHKVFIRVS